jgi:hypothetical protein
LRQDRLEGPAHFNLKASRVTHVTRESPCLVSSRRKAIYEEPHPETRAEAFNSFSSLAIAKRSGIGKARVALARKLSVILHSVWRSGKPFRWAERTIAA